MQLISKFNRKICFLFCVIDIFSKYAWVILLTGVDTSKSAKKVDLATLTLLSLGEGGGSFLSATNLNLKYFFCRGYCQKLAVRISRNSFSRRNKYLHV